MRLFMNKLSEKIKRCVTLLLTFVLLVTEINYDVMAATEENVMESDKNEENIIYTDETTEEILAMAEQGVSLDSFFAGELTRGITREDLLRWREEGKDINDVVLERAREKSLPITYSKKNFRETFKESGEENGLFWGEYIAKSYMAAPEADGRYYLTECTLPGDKGTVNLSGTAYENALFNTKTGGKGTSTPWYITLGGDEAMCVSYEGHASSVRKDHYYLEKNINNIKNNPYFEGENDYPVEKYLRGACYDYERILGSSGGSIYQFFNHASGMDAGLSELKRKAGSNMVTYSGKEVNQAVLQIITWRIAQGSFRAENMEYEHQIAQMVFGQMYGEGTIYGDDYARLITYFYDYYAECARESASGEYEQKYSSMAIKYWEVQGSESANWQDFITWDAGTNVPVKPQFKITKYGKIFSEIYSYPNAEFYVYSDSACTNKIGEFKTDEKGEGFLNVVEGVYYLKENKAPAGTIKNGNTITLTVKDTVNQSGVNNDEYYNGILFQKFDANTQRVIKERGRFALYEYVAGKDDYYKLCELSFTEKEIKSGSVTVPAYSYYMLGSTDCSYHHSDGSIAKKMKRATFVYTTVNQGKFKIVEEKAPEGYQLNVDGKEFVMDTSSQGYVWNFTTASDAISDEPFSAGIVMSKFDTLSEDRLEGAEFQLQEKIGRNWFDVGRLIYDSVNRVYKTSPQESYSYRNDDGEIVFQKTRTEYPVLRTTFNSGKMRIVETTKPDDRYRDVSVVKVLNLTHQENQYLYDFTNLSTGAKNIGKSIEVITAKYDAITNEQLLSKDIATMTIYEYNSSQNSWQELGNLSYNIDNDRYETDSEVYYTPHKADGTKSTAGVGSMYSAGYLYYTSVNNGRFKVVETISPKNYMLGVLDTENNSTRVYEKEFTINESTEDGQIIDFTDIVNAPKDTGLQANVILAKYDSMTKDKTDASAEFTVYEKIGEEWLMVGKLIYDERRKVYTSEGMALSLHNTNKEEIYTEDSAAGLYYTSANEGNYKIRETRAPQNYVLGEQPYEQEFNITTDAENDVVNLLTEDKAGYNLGIRGRLHINKYDAATEELVRNGNATVTVYERINHDWYEMGSLLYDQQRKSYVTEGVDFIYHNSLGEIVSQENVRDYETGYLYYTEANKGRFKITETAPPSFYTLTHPLYTKYEKEILLTEDNQEFVYVDFLEAIRNFGVNAIVKVNKYDEITKETTPKKDVKYEVQEYIIDLNQWMKAGEMVYDSAEDIYTLNGQRIELHDGEGEVKFTNSEGKLYYTTQNYGSFRIVEMEAPSYYVLGQHPYAKEFNIISDAENGTVNLTGLEDSAKNLGIRGEVTVAKYDSVTCEKVKTGDARFTVYEYIENIARWMPVGELRYDENEKQYVAEGVSFTFHNQSGDVMNITEPEEFMTGKLYYTSANKGRFKVVESEPPKYYTMEPFSGKERRIFEKEFVIDENDEKNSYGTFEEGADNTGIYSYINLLKYDAMTGSNVEFHDAEFMIEERVDSRWLKVGVMRFDETEKVYTTEGIPVILHNSEGKKTYDGNDGRLYYTTANEGCYRIRETKAPKEYVLGSSSYLYEFNVLNQRNHCIDLTDRVTSPHNMGIYAGVEVAKYDDITKEPVRTEDTEFTVYEYIQEKGEWLETGKLVYNQSTKLYDGDGVEFRFHDESGKELNTSELTDFERGHLYYTTANLGRFKVVETAAPENYTMGEFNQEFVISGDTGQRFSFDTVSTAAFNRGREIAVEVKKYDSITKSSVEYKDIIFELQEYIYDMDTWLAMGELVYDSEKDAYSTKGMEQIVYHNSTGEVVYSTSCDKVVYTTANQGIFRVIEKEAPTCYEAGSIRYAREFSMETDVVEVRNEGYLVDLKAEEDSAKNIGISGIVRVAKFDKITKEKVLASDAVFTIYEYIEEADRWLEVGTLGFDEKRKEYTCDDRIFIFHDTDGNEIDTTDILDFEQGRLYYTTANDGNYKVVETKAPKYYRIDGYERTFNIKELENNVFTDVSTAAYDSGVRGQIELVKSDSVTKLPVEGAKFAAQEWSEQLKTWLDVGYLTDEGDGNYSTRGMTVTLHSGEDNDSSHVIKTGTLQYTTQNMGKFRIVEKEAPQGYLNDMYVSQTLTVSEDGAVIALKDNEGATDTPIRVSIAKKSITTSQNIEGAKLTVRDSQGNVVDSWVTDGTAHIIAAIPAGIYTLTEERAPLGYRLGAEITFEVKNIAEIQKVEMFDEEITGRLVICKTDKITKNPLKDAVFEIMDEKGEVIEELTTDDNGRAISGELNFGIYEKNGRYVASKTYKIVEKRAPAGYEIDNSPMEVRFDSEELKDLSGEVKVVEKIIEVENEKSPTVRTGDTCHKKHCLYIMSISVLLLLLVRRNNIIAKAK